MRSRPAAPAGSPDWLRPCGVSCHRSGRCRRRGCSSRTDALPCRPLPCPGRWSFMAVVDHRARSPWRFPFMHSIRSCPVPRDPRASIGAGLPAMAAAPCGTGRADPRAPRDRQRPYTQDSVRPPPDRLEGVSFHIRPAALCSGIETRRLPLPRNRRASHDMAKKNAGGGVYRVTEIIGTNAVSWEEAARRRFAASTARPSP